MRAWWAVALLVLGPASAAAQEPPAAPAQDLGVRADPLHLTSESLEAPLGDVGDVLYAMALEPGAAGDVPFGTSTAYASWGLTFEFDPQGNFTFLDDPVLDLAVRCNAAAVPVLYAVGIYVAIVDDDASFPTQAYTSASLPVPCVQQVADLAVPLRIGGLGLAEGERLQVELRHAPPNVRAAPSYAVVVGDADHPSRLRGNWTSGPVFVQLAHSFRDGDDGGPSLSRFFTTDAEAVRLRVSGNVSGASGYFDLSIRRPQDGTRAFQQRYETPGEGRFPFELEQDLPAGPRTCWQVVVTSYGEPAYNLTLTPVVVTVVEEIVPPAANATANATAGPTANTTAPPAEDASQDTPGLAALAGATTLAAAAWWRRRRR